MTTFLSPPAAAQISLLDSLSGKNRNNNNNKNESNPESSLSPVRNVMKVASSGALVVDIDFTVTIMMCRRLGPH